jgi:broad specificity phosphatase PhoE
MPAQTGRTLVYLLRHGATEWNAEQRVMGRRPVPLSSAGAAQIRALAPGLRALGLGSVWTSPVARARETADIVAGVLDPVPVRELEDLAEVDYAQWEGRRFKELFDDPVFREHLTDPLRSRAPGGGENLVEVGVRVARALSAVVAGCGGRPALVVSHGDPLRLLVAACLGLDASALRRIRIDPGGLSALALGGPWPEVCFLNRETVSVRMGEGAE